MGQDLRLRGRKQFARLFSQGRKIAGRNLILWHAGSLEQPQPSCPPAPARMGLAVSAKLGNAVFRNRLKRLIREAFRLNRSQLKPGCSMVIYLRPGCRWAGLRDAEVDFLEICKKARLLRL